MKFKLKKINIITIALGITSLIACLIYGFVSKKIPEILAADVSAYKFHKGLKLFFTIVPAIISTGGVIGWSIDFGKNQDGCRLRFSPSMMKKFKNVMINSIIGVVIMVFCDEIFLTQQNLILSNLEEKISLLNEYQDGAEEFYKEKRYETAYQYARLAFQIDQTNPRTRELLDLTEKSVNQVQSNNYEIQDVINSIGQDKNLFGTNIVKQKRLMEPFTSYELLKTARQCQKDEDWFGAHYYAQTALETANPKDINILELKNISAKAWNEISQARTEGTSEAKKIYAKKFEGYTALLENDILKAYYIFKTLSNTSKKLSLDPDVIRYLKIAEQRLEKQYFFIDETFNLQGFEKASNVYFSIFNPTDGSTNIYFIKGITETGTQGSVVQYLRGMTIVNIDAKGNYRCGYYVPYARMTSIQTEYFTQEIKDNLGLTKDIKSIPYVLLRSVDRKQQGVAIDPVFKGGYDKTINQNFLLMPIEYNDFNLLKKASKGATTMDILSLLDFVPKSEKYGYSLEVYEQESMNRLLKPLFLLIIMIFMAWTAWHCRTRENSVFKFSWIIMFPLVLVSFEGMYFFSMSILRLTNYGLFNIFGHPGAIYAGIILNVILLILSSIAFLACHNDDMD